MNKRIVSALACAFAFAASAFAAAPTALSGSWLSEEVSMTMPDESVMTDQYDIDFGTVEGTEGPCGFKLIGHIKNLDLQSLGHANVNINLTASGKWALKDGNIDINLDPATLKVGTTPDDVTIENPDIKLTQLGINTDEIKNLMSGIVNDQMVPLMMSKISPEIKEVTFENADLEGTVLTVKADEANLKFNRK